MIITQKRRRRAGQSPEKGEKAGREKQQVKNKTLEFGTKFCEWQKSAETCPFRRVRSAPGFRTARVPQKGAHLCHSLVLAPNDC